MLQCVDDSPNWPHRPNAGAVLVSGLAATVATTGQYMGSIWKSQYMGKVYGKVYGKFMEKVYGKAYMEKEYGQIYGKVDGCPNWSHQANAGTRVVSPLLD